QAEDDIRDRNVTGVHTCALPIFARNTSDLLEIVKKLADKGVGLEFVDNPGMNVGTAQGEFMLTIFAAFAQFERELIKERQAEGIAAAKNRGVYSRPRPKARALTPQQIAGAKA